MTPSRPVRSGATGVLGWGARCRGFQRASWNSRWSPGQGHVQVAHGHVWIDLTKQIHQGRQANTGPQHLRCIGVPKLVGNDARRKPEFMADLVEIIAELANERFLSARPGQEEAIVGERFERAKEAQPLHELANERVHRDQPFGFQFPERHMYGPLIRARGTEAVGREIGALTDAHAGVANQHEDIRAQVVAAEKTPAAAVDPAQG